MPRQSDAGDRWPQGSRRLLRSSYQISWKQVEFAARAANGQWPENVYSIGDNLHGGIIIADLRL